ncbi:unnamed protein product [Arabidopsis lyrata]|nr:unnamed protein product [Arabidopsis lyrata]
MSDSHPRKASRADLPHHTTTGEARPTPTAGPRTLFVDDEEQTTKRQEGRGAEANRRRKPVPERLLSLRSIN